VLSPGKYLFKFFLITYLENGESEYLKINRRVGSRKQSGRVYETPERGKYGRRDEDDQSNRKSTY